MTAFIMVTPVTGRRGFHASAVATRPALAAPAVAPAVTMAASGYNPRVDAFFAQDVRKQYIAKACPSGVPSLQCIEGTTASEPYDLRTLKRQSQLRYRQVCCYIQCGGHFE
jgi:hypothetical protein